jgi:acyl-CoA synthetase (AMP-forming)/AMP-acid ligase II
MPASTSLPKTIPALIEHNAHRWGDKEAITDGEVRLSWNAFDRERRRVAKALLAAGIRKGDRVSIWAPNIHEYVLATIGAQSIGAIWVPLNTRFKGVEAGDILRRSNTRLLFAIDNFLGADYVGMLKGEALPELEKIVMLRGAREGLIAWSDFLASGESVSDAELARAMAAVTPDDVMDLMFTSGTTGKPKGALLTHGQNIRVFISWGNMIGLDDKDTVLAVPPFFHSFGYKALMLGSLIHGARLIPAPVFDLDAVLPQIAADRVTVLPGPPTLYLSLLAHPKRKEYDLSSLRCGVTGAAVVPVEMIRRMYSELGFREIYTGYGLTECCGTVSMCLKGDDPETVANTSGHPIPDIEVRVIDPEGRELPRGQPGEIVVRGFHVMKGYFNDPEETAKAIDEDGWLHTGDVGIMDARSYITITDRIKDMYIVGGFNCYPAEIEGMMLAMPGIAQVAVIGVPDERQGEVGKAFILPKPGVRLSEAEVIAWCRTNMANIKVPRYVEFVDAFPLNATGKVLKTELRAQEKAQRAS